MVVTEYHRYDDHKTGDMEYPGAGVSLNDFSVDFWQSDVGAHVYKRVGPLTPYVGLGYERTELSIAGAEGGPSRPPKVHADVGYG